MNIIKTLGFAAVSALSLGVGAAMAQEGPSNDTITGSTYFGNRPPQVPAQLAAPGQQGVVQSGSSDIQTASTTSRYYWTPGVAY
jgi:hypothetical protein